jgi:hypothetical protein
MRHASHSLQKFTNRFHLHQAASSPPPRRQKGIPRTKMAIPALAGMAIAKEFVSVVKLG